ncbi:MAG: hypothetical protein ChlgKO_09310 [Chlamydiales bacterium]
MEITENRETGAKPELIWQTWKASSYWDLDKTSFSEGQKGHVMGKKRRGPAFTVTKIEEGKSFTLSWKAPMVKFDMQHEVLETASGSKIIYTMKLRGLMAYPMRLLLGRKIKRTLYDTLRAFVSHIEK